MRPIVVRVLALAAVLSVPLAAAPALAQEATPAAEAEGGGLPPGVAIEPVTQIAPVELPGDPSALAVYRLVMEPGSAIPTHPHPGTEVVVVEAGSASYLTEEGPAIQVVRGGAEGEAPPEAAGPGEEATTAAGDSAIFPAGNVSDTRAGDEGATLLIFELVADEGAEATPAGQATPAAGDAAPMEGVTIELLDSGEPAAAPGQTLVFARVTLDPGGYVGAHGHPGDQIWYVAAGTFSTEVLEGTMRITRAADGDTPAPAEELAAGAEATLAAGDSAFFGADVVHTVRQVGAEPAVILIPALLETGQPPLIFHPAHD